MIPLAADCPEKYASPLLTSQRHQWVAVFESIGWYAPYGEPSHEESWTGWGGAEPAEGKLPAVEGGRRCNGALSRWFGRDMDPDTRGTSR